MLSNQNILPFLLFLPDSLKNLTNDRIIQNQKINCERNLGTNEKMIICVRMAEYFDHLTPNTHVH